jgi:hypothetical protein
VAAQAIVKLQSAIAEVIPNPVIDDNFKPIF